MLHNRNGFSVAYEAFNQIMAFLTNINIRNIRIFCIFIALCLSLLPVAAKDPRYLPDGKPNAITLLAPPPLPDSPEQAADLQEVRTVSQSAPDTDRAAAQTETKFTMFTFTPEIGPFFEPGKFPKTEALLNNVRGDAETIVDNAKDYWKRPRPYKVDPSLANGKLEKSFSYPSGHSTESMVLALVMADLFPEHRDAIIGEARNIGWHRVEIARHYPTDIYAGRVLAQAIVRQMKKDADFQKDFAAAKAELTAAQVVDKGN
jgi:acid phosphatase (class A)